MATVSIQENTVRKSMGFQLGDQGDTRPSGVRKSSRKTNTKTNVAGMMSMASGGGDMDDAFKAIKSRKTERVNAKMANQTEALSGEEKLLKMTQKPDMEGLTQFTQMTGDAKGIRKSGVDVDVLASVIQDDEAQLTTCAALPWTLIFFCLFMLLFQQHYTTSFIYLNERNLRTFFADEAVNQDSIDGIYSWLTGTFLPYCYSTDQSLGNSYTPPLEGGDFQEQMGGFLIRAQFSKTETCTDSTLEGYIWECNDMWTVDTNGNQQVQNDQSLTSTYLSGWDLSDSSTRRLNSKEHLKANERRYPARSADPQGWVSEILGYVSSWFPGRATYYRAGRWKDAPAEKDGAAANDHAKAPSGKDKKKGGRKSIPDKFRSADKLTKGRKSWQKLKSWRPFKSARRIVDPMDSYGRADRAVQIRRPVVPLAVPNDAHPNEGKERMLRTTRPEFGMSGWIPYPFAKTDVWEYTFPMSAPQSQVAALINKWKDAKLFDRSTLFVGVEAVFRNPTIGQGVVSHSFVNFVFSRGGHIYVEVLIQSMVLADEKIVLLWGFGFCSLLVFNTIAVPSRTCMAWKRRKLCNHMSRAWNILEWFLVLYGWVIVMVFMAERWGVRKFNKQYKDYAAERPTIAAADLQAYDVSEFEKIHKNTYNTGSIDVYLQTFVANYHLWLILRFFMASRGQPRLAIVAETMRAAAIDLFHLFIVFGIIFIAYVVSGHILFGRRMEPFATLEGAIAYTVQIVLMKEFDFQTLTEQDFLTSCIWVYTFVLLVVLVLINIILAMIFDTYGEVRSHVMDGDSIGSTMGRIFTQIRLMNVWVNNTDLLMALRGISEKSEKVSVEDLRAAIPDISPDQVGFLFNQAKAKVEGNMIKGNKNALPEAIASVLIGIASLKDGVALMDPRNKMARGSTPGGKDSVLEDAPVEAKGPDGGAEDAPEQYVVDADGKPFWLSQGLFPFLDEQEKTFNKAYDDLYSVESQMVGRGIGAKLPKTGYSKPADPRGNPDAPLVLPWAVAAKRVSMQGPVGRAGSVAAGLPQTGVPSSVKGNHTVSA